MICSNWFLNISNCFVLIGVKLTIRVRWRPMLAAVVMYLYTFIVNFFGFTQELCRIICIV